MKRTHTHTAKFTLNCAMALSRATSRELGSQIGGWLLAVLVVGLAHVLLLWGLFQFDATPTASGTPESIMLEFAAEPESPSVEQAGETLQQATIAETAPNTPQDTPEDDKQHHEPEKQPTPDIAKPQSNMTEEVEKTPRQQKQQANTKTTAKPAERAKHTQPSAAPELAARTGKTFAAPRNSRTDGAYGREVANWQTSVQRKIARAASRISSRYSGTQALAYITFRINASGHIIAANVARSSGDAQTDSAALRAVNRATPVAAPPRGWRGSLTVPVEVRP